MQDRHTHLEYCEPTRLGLSKGWISVSTCTLCRQAFDMMAECKCSRSRRRAEENNLLSITWQHCLGSREKCAEMQEQGQLNTSDEHLLLSRSPRWLS